MSTELLSYEKLNRLCNQRRYLMRNGKSRKSQLQLEQSLERVETFLNAYPKISQENLVRFVRRSKQDILTIIPSNQNNLITLVQSL